MEKGRYWMWAKTKQDLSPRIVTPVHSHGDSWEEQAFAEDAAGTLGGCVWPPRSYSCSFCRREFRSAQALGGHMNVHRRDRARLKQSSNSPTDVVPPSYVLNPCTSFDAPYSSSQLCTFLYDNPKPEFSDTLPLVSPLSHVFRVSSSLATKVSTEENISAHRFFSPLVQKNDKDNIVSSHPPSWSTFLSEKRDRVLDSIRNEPKKPTGVDSDSRTEREDCVPEDLSMNMNLVVFQKQTNSSCDEQVAGRKRRRVEAKPLSFLPKLSAVERCHPQSEVLKLCSAGSTDEPDLELRLGNAPKRLLLQVLEKTAKDDKSSQLDLSS